MTRCIALFQGAIALKRCVETSGESQVLKEYPSSVINTERFIWPYNASTKLVDIYPFYVDI